MLTPQQLAQLEGQYGLPTGLLGAVRNTESGGNANAVSPKGALGAFQFMPATAKSYGIDPLNEQQAAQGAAKMYSDLLNQYGGDLPKALAGYNWGSGNLAKYGMEQAPQETRDYISKVQGQLPQTQSVVTPVNTEAALPNDELSAIEAELAKRSAVPEQDELAAIDAELAKRSQGSVPELSRGRTALEQGLGGATFNMADEVYNRFGALGAYGYQALTDMPTASQDSSLGGYNLGAVGRGVNSLQALTDEATAGTQERLNRQIQERPALSIASNIAGALLMGGAGATTKGGAAVSNSLRSGEVLGRDLGLLGRAAKGSIAGAASGGLAGFGAGSGDARAMSSLLGAGLGAGVGAVAPAAISALGGILGKTSEAIGNSASKALAKYSGEIIPTNDPALKKVYARLVADYGDDEAKKILNSYASSKGKSLVEAGGARTANLAEGAAQYPSGGARATEFFDEAVGIAPEKLKGSLGKNVSPSANYYDTADAIVDQGRAKVAPLYNQAYKANQQVDSPVIRQVLETPEGKSALQNAVRDMQDEMRRVGVSDPELTQLAQEAGMQATGSGVAKGLKLRTLDYTKRAIDRSIRTARRAGDEESVMRWTNLKNDLVSELDKADKTGLYAKARKESGDYLSATDALEQGTRFLKDDSQLIQRNFSLMGATEKKAYKAGVLKAMREQIENTVDGSNVARMFNKSATRQKLGAILSPREYTKLMDDAMAADKIYKLRNQITGNSRTAGRQIAAEEFETAGAEIVDDLLNKGARRTAGERTIKWISRRFDGLSDQSAGDVAKILYETDPQQKYKIVKELSNLAKQQNPRGTEAGKKLRAFYSISDGISNANENLRVAIPVAGGSIASPKPEPTRIEVNPNQPNPYRGGDALPEVELPKTKRRK